MAIKTKQSAICYEMNAHIIVLRQKLLGSLLTDFWANTSRLASCQSNMNHR
jgi:hypothetical protein